MLYKAYRKHEQNHKEFQINHSGGSDNKLFDFTSEEQNIDLHLMLSNTVSVDVAKAPKGWRVCHH